MKFILGTKKEMTQFFDEDGRSFAATLVSAGPITITQIKKKDTDGYSSVQVGFGARRANLLKKPVEGHLKDLAPFRYLREFRLSEDEVSKSNKGDVLNVSIFSKGDIIDVSGVSKGKGFQGVVKRHGFSGGPRTHGQRHSEREPGSIGGGLRTRVPKNMRMPGRMGGNRVTVKNLQVLDVDPEKNLILIKGAIPGRRGTLIEIRESKKLLPRKAKAR